MKLIDKDHINELKKLYNDIDNCISDLVVARGKRDNDGIAAAHWQMETLMVNTQQTISYILDTIEVKEADYRLSLEDISILRQIMFDYNRQVRNEMSIPNNEDYCKEILKRFKAQKGEQYDTRRKTTTIERPLCKVASRRMENYTRLS